MTDIGLLFAALVFFVDEPPLIFTMSALALIFGGGGFVVTAVLAKVEEEIRDNDA